MNEYAVHLEMLSIVSSRCGHFLLNHLAPSSSATIKVSSVLISHLQKTKTKFVYFQWFNSQIDWPVLQFFLCHIAFLQWSQHPSQFSQSCHPIWFHSQTWWHFLHQSSGKTLKDTIQDVSTRWIIKKAPTYSTKQKPHGVLVNLSSPMMILLTSPHLPNNS